MKIELNEAETEAVVTLDYSDVHNIPPVRLGSLLVPALAQLLSRTGSSHPEGNPEFKVDEKGSGDKSMILTISARVI